MIRDLTARLGIMKGPGVGVNDHWGYIIAGVSLILLILQSVSNLLHGK
jgi:hypothetical protein